MLSSNNISLHTQDLKNLGYTLSFCIKLLWLAAAAHQQMWLILGYQGYTLPEPRHPSSRLEQHSGRSLSAGSPTCCAPDSLAQLLQGCRDWGGSEALPTSAKAWSQLQRLHPQGRHSHPPPDIGVRIYRCRYRCEGL